MNVPLCVLECPDHRLRDRATFLFQNNANENECRIAMVQCIDATNAIKRAALFEQREKGMKEWMFYLSGKGNIKLPHKPNE